MKDSETKGQGQNKSSHLSTQIPWPKTISCTSHITFISRRQKNQQERRWWHLWQIMDNNGLFWNSQCRIFKTTTILNIWQLIRWLYFSKGQLHSSRISKRNINISELKFTNDVTIKVTQGIEAYAWKDQKKGHKRHDSDQCYSETTDKKGKGGIAISYIQTITFFSWVNDLTEHKINCCGTVRPNLKGKPDYFISRTQTEKQEC